jgi:beta-phosphoglucomutase-like phosphatase (HAD superfamily)
MIYKAAIFDFNGTLFWDTSYHNEAFDIFLLKHNITLTDQEKRVKIHGKSNRDIMTAIFEREFTNDEAAPLALEKELIYQNLCVNDLQLGSGAEDLLDLLKGKRIPFTIATSCGVENVDFYFNNMNLKNWFTQSGIIFNDGSLRAKPFPDLFLAAAQKLNTSPSETVFFEDSIAGIQAAENAGAGKIYIVNSTNEDFSNSPHEVITHFNQVDRKLFGL